MKKRITRLAAVVLTAAMTVGGVGSVSAFAAGEAPSSETPVNSSIVTVTAHRAASPLPEMLGANTPSGFGMINGSAPTAATADDCFALKIWATDYNVSPDPYWANYYYNFKGGNSSYALLNPGFAGSPIKADTTLVSKYGDISVSLYTRPDIAIGVSANNNPANYAGYDDQLETINGFEEGDDYYQEGDEDYDPALVAYDPTTLDTMITTTNNAAAAIVSSGKSYRYDNPQTIATDYSNYIKGIKGYIKRQIALGNISKKTIAIVSDVTTSTDSSGNTVYTYTIDGQGSTATTSTNRYVEYTQDVTTNLTTSASATATSAQLAAVDAIIITSNDTEAAVKNDSTITESNAELITVNRMETLYGIRMNSVENALGMGYILGRIYDKVLPNLNAANLYEYYAEKFYHTDPAYLSTILNRAVVNKLNGYPNIDSAEQNHINNDSSITYSASDLKNLFAANAQYY